jgi:hypothetical protein
VLGALFVYDPKYLPIGATAPRLIEGHSPIGILSGGHLYYAATVLECIERALTSRDLEAVVAFSQGTTGCQSLSSPKSVGEM